MPGLTAAVAAPGASADGYGLSLQGQGRFFSLLSVAEGSIFHRAGIYGYLRVSPLSSSFGTRLQALMCIERRCSETWKHQTLVLKLQY